MSPYLTEVRVVQANSSRHTQVAAESETATNFHFFLFFLFYRGCSDDWEGLYDWACCTRWKQLL